MRLSLSSAALMIGLIASGAFAATPVKTNLGATSSVANSCQIISADSLSFGAYSPVSGVPSTASGQINLVCTKAAAYSIVPTTGGSRLTGAGGSLNYALYVDSAMSQQWGAPAYVSSTVTNTVNYIGMNNSYTTAQWKANPALNDGAYYFANGTYYTGFVGVGNGTISGATYTLSMSTTSYKVPIIGHVADATTLPKSTGNGPYDSALYFVLPTDTSLYSGSGGTYTVKFPQGTNQGISGTSPGAKSAITKPYYAKLPAGQDLIPGAYTDTVVLTVSF